MNAGVHVGLAGACLVVPSALVAVSPSKSKSFQSGPGRSPMVGCQPAQSSRKNAKKTVADEIPRKASG